jgi:poly-gamma-glutamate synthesis protein (capsule biosynthesis protein)
MIRPFHRLFHRPLAGLLLAMFAAALLTACRPIELLSSANAPVPPLGTSVFPTPTAPPPALLLPPVVKQPPTPAGTDAPPAPTPTLESLEGTVTVGLDASLPEAWATALLARLTQTSDVQTATGPQPLRVLDQAPLAASIVTLRPYPQATAPLAERIFAVAAPFATIRDDITLAELTAAWQNGAPALYTTAESAALLRPVLGDYASNLTSEAELLAALENTPGALAVLPFDQLDPRVKALTIDGANVLSNQFNVLTWPLAVALSVEGAGASAVRPALQDVVQPYTNRDASRLTQLIMTGVTAMSRVTAVKMDQKGYDYPALVISDVFTAADITHISNEVPFLDDCVANPAENNLILCSDTDYWAALAALGTDIVGLSGNHVNDFGRDGAQRSLSWYRDNGIPIYGSGFNVEEACAPLLWEDHGNTFAFIAALAFYPEGAWATVDQPGACYYFDNQATILELVRQLSGFVDVVAVELQHSETYEPYPIASQIADFRELRAAGADIVTGVQSHVPQAQEPYGAADVGGPGMISYGLGNLFFDQMWSWETRTELATRHTIYDGRLLNTELLAMVLEDFAQPRWATPEERADILNRIFNAAPPRQ